MNTQQTMLHHPHDAGWIAEQFAKLSEEFHQFVRESYSQRYQKDGAHDGERRRHANNYLREIVDVLTLASGDKRLVADQRFPMIAAKIIECFGLEQAAQWARTKGVRVPRYPVIEQDPHAPNSQAAVARRLCSPDWWSAQLIKKHRRDEEAVQIRAGKVCKGDSPYVSQLSRDNFQYRQQQLEAWKKQAVLIADDGSEISLDSADHEHAAAFIKFAEVMVRVNGMSAIAGDNYLCPSIVAALPEHLTKGDGGALADVVLLDAVTAADPEQWCGIAFTLTTPSRFHRYRYDKKSGRIQLNPRYDAQKTPADARDWLQETWKLTQTAWKRKTKHIQPVSGFGFRMDEGHHDGVSHYHYGIWVKAKDAQRAVQMFYDKALRGEYTDRVKQQHLCSYGVKRDAKEAGADVHRLNFKIMTTASGMVSYMVKYITKGLTGADWEDLNAGIPSDQTIISIMARKSVWGLRQYAFWNAPSIMAWRELRRLGDDVEVQSDVLEPARAAAKAKDWKAYTIANGGADCQARMRPIRMMRKPKHDVETDADALNQYGEYIQQVRGLLVENAEVQTRFKEWYLLNLQAMKKLLVTKFLRESDTLRTEMPVNFGDDLQSVIDRAKSEGKVKKLAERAGIVMFPNPPPLSSSSGEFSPLGLVGLTSHENNGGLAA